MSGTSSLQAARTSTMSQSAALDALDNVGKARGNKRVRENSRTFCKGAKRQDLNVELKQYRQKICGDNTRLQQVWDKANTQHGLANVTHDMTGNELRALVQAVRNEMQSVQSETVDSVSNSTPDVSIGGRPSFDFNGQAMAPQKPMSMRPSFDFSGQRLQVPDNRPRSETPVFGVDDIPGPPMTDEDEAELQQMIDVDVQTKAAPKDKTDWSKVFGDAAKVTNADELDFDE